jgi:hypothetical protein
MSNVSLNCFLALSLYFMMEYSVSQLQKLALTSVHTLLLMVNAICNIHGNAFVQITVDCYQLLLIAVDYFWPLGD